MEKLLISMIVFCLGIGVIYVVETCNYPIPEDKIIPASVIKSNVESFTPKGEKFKKVMYDYRSSEPTPEELVQFLETHPEVTTVIRLNGTGKDSDGLGLGIEAGICKKKGINFYFYPMTTPYESWGEIVTKIMLKETVLVHCHHGYDRTGFIFAYKLMKYHGYSFEEVQKMNRWDNYDKYSKKFYSTLQSIK